MESVNVTTNDEEASSDRGIGHHSGMQHVQTNQRQLGRDNNGETVSLSSLQKAGISFTSDGGMNLNGNKSDSSMESAAFDWEEEYDSMDSNTEGRKQRLRVTKYGKQPGRDSTGGSESDASKNYE